MIEKKQENQLLQQLDLAGYKGLKEKHINLDFKDLMKFRIEKILMVSSLYDYYTIVEDGHLQEAIYSEYIEMNLYYAPVIERTFTGEKALEMIAHNEYDLVITNLRLGDMDLSYFCKKAKEIHKDLPVVLLASQSRELVYMKEEHNLEFFDKIFIWNGDRRVLLAIIKYFEDKNNAKNDCLEYGVTGIILVEDSPEFYSSFLPLLYTEVMNQSQRLISEGMNSAEKMLRQRARPKIFLACNYEEAIYYYKKYRNSLLGIITDLAFPVNNQKDDEAGIKLIKEVKDDFPSLPIILQTSQTHKAYIAKENNVAFIDKNSRTLLKELRDFILANFGFGDFIFKYQDGTEILRAYNIRDFVNKLQHIPEDSLLYHSNNNHFSYWFIARTEFELANKIRPVHFNQFDNSEELRNHLISLIRDQLKEENRGLISRFSKDEFDEGKLLQMIGEGSIGGKARGIAFIDKILKDYVDKDYFKNVEVSIPKTMIIGTEVFSEFLEINNLYSLALGNYTDNEILEKFQEAELPEHIYKDLVGYVKKNKYPIAVRSSSLLEDAMYQPFAGIYSTIIMPNSSSDNKLRLKNLTQAIKYIYASTFFKNAKNYLEATGNRIEEEKMGIIIQKLVGRRHGNYFYPNISGVIRSYNYYPFGKAKPEDGLVKLALGLGRTIVDGGISLQYCPAFPKVYPQFGTIKDMLQRSQTSFWVLDLSSDISEESPSEEKFLKKLEIETAEKHGVLNHIASTFSPENDMVFEGITANGPRILTFAPILKSNIIPLNDIIKLISKIAEISLNSPVEIEFAVSMKEKNEIKAKFEILQVRPMVKPEGMVEILPEEKNRDNLVLSSDTAMGNGFYEIYDIIYLKPENFNLAKTREMANQISDLNKKLIAKNSKYLLIGFGRWGTSDPWLGIPINFSDITGAQVIVEAQLPERIIEPSQGSHFFHNMTSFKIAYLTIKNIGEMNYINWDWLNNQETVNESEFIKHVKTKKNITLKVEGKSRQAIAIKPN